MSKIKKVRKHTHHVEALCEAFADRLLLDDADRRLLCGAARWHDVGKLLRKKKGKDHAKRSGEFVMAWGLTEDPHFAAKIIRAHRGKFNPPEEVWQLAAILRLSDKLARFRREKEDALEKCVDSWEKITEWCRGEGLLESREYSDLKAAYKKLLEKELWLTV